MNNKKSYVYKITCKITGEFYFGSSFYAKSDRYWGGGTKIRERVAQYGKENFVKEILGEFDDRTIAHQVENQYIEKFINDDKCLNKKLEYHFRSFSEETRAKIGAANAVSNLGKHFSKEHRAKIGAAKLGKHHTDESRAKMSAAHRGEKNPMYGKHCTEETRAKMSAANRGENHPMYGKHLSEEHRAKIAAALRGNTNVLGKHWRKNPITGKREWYD